LRHNEGWLALNKIHVARVSAIIPAATPAPEDTLVDAGGAPTAAPKSTWWFLLTRRPATRKARAAVTAIASHHIWLTIRRKSAAAAAALGRPTILRIGLRCFTVASGGAESGVVETAPTAAANQE
jgi:hypothetical protein